MAFDDPTTNFGWHLPDQGADLNEWGDVFGTPTDPEENLNTIIAAIDADAKTVEDAKGVEVAAAADLGTRITALESGQFLPVYARVEMTAPQSIPHSTTAVLDFTTALGFQSGDEDAQMYDPGDGTKLTVPDGSAGALSGGGRFNLSGLYRVRAAAKVPFYAQSDDGYAWVLTIRKNGSTTAATRRWPALNAGGVGSSSTAHGGGFTDNPLTLEVEALDEAEVGDYYEVTIHSESGGTSQPVSEDVTAEFSAVRMPSPRAAVPHVLFSAGYDVHGNSSTDFERYNQASVASDTVEWETSAGKFSGGNLRQEYGSLSQSLLRHTILDTPVSAGRAAFYIRETAFTYPQGHFLRIFSGSTLQFEVSSLEGANGVIVVRDDGGSTVATGTVDLSASAYTHVEVQWSLSTSGAAFVKVWVDGVLSVDASGLTLGSGGEVWNGYGRSAPFGGTKGFRIDDFVIQDSTGLRLDDGHRIYTVSPDGDAGTNEWTPTTGTDHYAMVDDTDPDQSTTRLTSTGAGKREEFTFTMPSIAGDIREVVVKCLMDVDADNIGPRLGLKTGSTEDLSSELPTAVSAGGSLYNEYTYSVAGPPSGGAWTEANLADVVALIQSSDSSTSASLTQVWLEILTTA